MEEISDRSPAECPSCGEFFDPREEGIERTVTDEGESRVTCPHCGASFHPEADLELGDLGDEEF